MMKEHMKPSEFGICINGRTNYQRMVMAKMVDTMFVESVKTMAILCKEGIVMAEDYIKNHDDVLATAIRKALERR